MRSPTLVAAIATSAFLIAGCEAVSPAAKYGGPPPGYERPVALDAAAADSVPSATPTPTTGPTSAPTPSTSASSPRLSQSANPHDDHVVAPVAKYGGPPRR